MLILIRRKTNHSAPLSVFVILFFLCYAYLYFSYWVCRDLFLTYFKLHTRTGGAKKTESSRTNFQGAFSVILMRYDYCFIFFDWLSFFPLLSSYHNTRALCPTEEPFLVVCEVEYSGSRRQAENDDMDTTECLVSSSSLTDHYLSLFNNHYLVMNVLLFRFILLISCLVLFGEKRKRATLRCITGRCGSGTLAGGLRRTSTPYRTGIARTGRDKRNRLC